ASMVLMAVLVVKVQSLQRQINIIVGSESEIRQNEKGATAGDSDVIHTTLGGTGEENLADPEDTLKVYLTFDDGPSDNTEDILNILDDYGVKATFFVIGKDDEHSREMYTRIVNEGHTIGMHSYSHKYSDIYSSLDAFASDLDRIQNLIYDVTGVDSLVYRFPGGSSNQVSDVEMNKYIEYLNQNNIRYFDWNVSSGDATSQAYSPDELVENVMRDVVKYKTSVVLMHDADAKDATVAALPALIEKLQAEGAVLLPISDDTTLIQHVKIDQESAGEGNK
ncbi:MAG: polysaccharide deacetylase, partial [Lachnospiraceae bacterium]|nr:polysaccharide deacetylase [Lachnospiraceae bacterium]